MPELIMPGLASTGQFITKESFYASTRSGMAQYAAAIPASKPDK
jgi:hypothetical protein